jgi:uncharacterized protein YbjT (DUF2867 family)
MGAGAVRGDLTDPASLRAACSGIDTVVCTATAIARLLSGAGGPSIRDVDEVGASALVDAAQTAGVERFVYISYAGVDAGLGFPIERAKAAVERRLAESSMRVTVVRPDAFQDVHLAPLGRFDMRAGKVSVFGAGNAGVRWVGMDDVAELITHVLAETDPPSVIEFGGPESMSRNEAIALVEQFTGRTMKRQRMPRFLLRLAVGVLSKTNPALASVFGLGLLQDLGLARWDDTPLRERGIQARTATDFLRAQATSLGR